jgi:hypothetical protein
MCLLIMAYEMGLDSYEREMKVKEKRRACVTRFATSRKPNTYLKMLLKDVIGGDLA